MTTSRSAQTTIDRLLIWGVVLLLAGGAVVAFGYPHTEQAITAVGEDEEVGSAVAVTVGVAAAGVGQLLFLIGAVGKGVQLGVAATERP